MIKLVVKREIGLLRVPIRLFMALENNNVPTVLLHKVIFDQMFLAYQYLLIHLSGLISK